MTKRSFKKWIAQFPTMTLTQVKAAMGAHFGPEAQVGWVAALNKTTNQVVMCAGHGAVGIFMSNVQGCGYEVRQVVEG